MHSRRGQTARAREITHGSSTLKLHRQTWQPHLPAQRIEPHSADLGQPQQGDRPRLALAGLPKRDGGPADAKLLGDLGLRQAGEGAGQGEAAPEVLSGPAPVGGHAGGHDARLTLFADTYNMFARVGAHLRLLGRAG